MKTNYKINIDDGRVYVDWELADTECFDPHSIGRAVEKYLINHIDEKDPIPTLMHEECIEQLNDMVEELSTCIYVMEFMAKIDGDTGELKDHIVDEENEKEILQYKDCVGKLKEVADFLSKFPYIDPDDSKFEPKEK